MVALDVVFQAEVVVVIVVAVFVKAVALVQGVAFVKAVALVQGMSFVMDVALVVVVVATEEAVDVDVEKLPKLLVVLDPQHPQDVSSC